MGPVRRVVGGHEVAATLLDRARRGDREPPVVVLVHGVGVSSRYLVRLARALSGDAVVVAPDLVGFGASPRADEPLTIGEHADALGGLLDALGVTRPALLVGHSMGAQVATELAVRRPDLCRGLVLLGPVVDPDAPSPVAQGLRLARDTPREPWSGVVVQVREWLRTGVRWYLGTARRMCEHRLDERLALADVPVTLVRGARDPVTPAAFLAALARTAPDARTVEVPGAAHLVMWSRPESVAAVCRERLGVRA